MRDLIEWAEVSELDHWPVYVSDKPIRDELGIKHPTRISLSDKVIEVCPTVDIRERARKLRAAIDHARRALMREPLRFSPVPVIGSVE